VTWRATAWISSPSKLDASLAWFPALAGHAARAVLHGFGIVSARAGSIRQASHFYNLQAELVRTAELIAGR